MSTTPPLQQQEQASLDIPSRQVYRRAHAPRQGEQFFPLHSGCHADVALHRYTAKSRRKEERKKASGGKRGTVWEEEYLLGSLSRTVETRLPSLQSAPTGILFP